MKLSDLHLNERAAENISKWKDSHEDSFWHRCNKDISEIPNGVIEEDKI